MRRAFFPIAVFFLSALPVYALNGALDGQQIIRVEEVLRYARNESEELKALQISTTALKAEINARDLVMATRLSSEFSQLWDQRDTVNPVQRRFSRLFSMGLSKPFETGTQLDVRTSYEEARIRRGTNVVAAATEIRFLTDWEVSISQSLWRDFFGRATRYRQDGDRAEFKARMYRLMFQQQEELLRIENLYWDWVFALREQEIRKLNFHRSQTIEKWTKERLARSAAEPTDLLNSQALVANRELQLQTVRDRLDRTALAFRLVFPNLKEVTNFKPDFVESNRARTPQELMIGPRVKVAPERLDSLASRYSATAAQNRSKQIREETKPDLNLVFSHGNNGIDADSGTSIREAYGTDQPFNRVALVFNANLDFGLMAEQKTAARLTAEAEELRSRQLARQSELQWTDLVREIQSLGAQVVLAEKHADLQRKKAEAEKLRYARGRTTAAQAITFEQEAAEAELRAAQLMVDLRKAEARSRLFTTQEAEST